MPPAADDFEQLFCRCPWLQSNASLGRPSGLEVNARAPVRPKTVVIVDAENPLVEIHGEFFWREDHEQIVLHERESAYKAGYGEGFAAGSRAAAGSQRIAVRYRPPFVRRVVTRLIAVMVVVAFLLTLLGGILEGNPHP